MPGVINNIDDWVPEDPLNRIELGQADKLRESVGDEVYFTTGPMTPELHKELRDRLIELAELREKLLSLYRKAKIEY